MRRWLALAGLLAVGPPVPATSVGPQDMAAMMQGMLTMMKLWNAFSSASDMDFQGAFSPRSALGGSSWSDPWSAVPWMGMPWADGTGVPSLPWSGSGGVPGLPWSGVGPMPGMPGAGGRGVPRMPGVAPSRPVSSALEGRWQGASGEWLEFRGDRFQLGAPQKGQISGTFLVHGDRLVAYVPQADTTRLYRFERRGAYLALMDESGQVLLFRRAR
jgi:hypothetical protein